MEAPGVEESAGSRDRDRWLRLSPACRRALGWAVALKGDRASLTVTETILLGIIRSQAGSTEPELLLRHFGHAPTELVEVVRALQPGHNLEADRPRSLRTMPRLSGNATAALRNAESLADEAWEGSAEVQLSHLFGGLLRVPRSVAYVALRTVLAGAPLDEVAGSYEDYLRLGRDASYADFLQEQFPRPDAASRSGFGQYPGFELPAAPPVVGREDFVQQVIGSLVPGATVNLTGPPGAGKTTIAVEVARAVAGNFSDGVVYVAWTSESTLDEVLDRVQAAVGRGRGSWNLLMILDSLPPLEQTLLPPSTTSALLTVSREPLPGVSFLAPPLDDAGAQALLTAESEGQPVNPETSRRVNRLTQGIPGRIREAAAALGKYGARFLEIAGEASDEFLKQVEAAQTAYDALTEDEQAMVPLLTDSIEMSVADAARMAGRSPDQMRRALEHMRDLGLLQQRAGGRFAWALGGLILARRLAGARAAEPRRFTSALTQLSADAASGADALGFDSYVEPLCEVLIAQDTKPPVAVGLFGEWGTGKSFFMRMMQESIRERSEQAKKGGSNAFCMDVRQVRFNAWSYLDANIWASLMTEIFAQLARPDGSDGSEEDWQREVSELTDRLLTRRMLLKDAESARGDATRSKEEAEKQVAALRRKQDSIIDTLGQVQTAELSDLGAEIADLPGLDQVRDDLGIPKEASATQVIEAAEAVRGAGGRLRLLRRRVERHRLLLILGAAACVVLLGLGTFVLQGGAQRLAQVVGALALLSGLPAGLIAAGQTASRALDVVGKARQRQEEQRKKRLAAAESELAQLKVRLEAAQRDVESARVAEQETQREIDDIKGGRRVFRFIQERAVSTDYRSQLGVVALVRQDLAELSRLLEENRLARVAGKEPPAPGLPEIDRVILYVDDLDRCPARQVVQVLEAVHLLLAFDIFVVVVGVDPRWLRTSLRRHFSAQLGRAEAEGPRAAYSPRTADGARGADGRDRVADGDLEDWTASPEAYLEKIFQLPLAIPRMEQGGFDRLVDDLMVPRPTPSAEAGPPVPGDREAGSPNGAAAAAGAADDASDAGDEAGGPRTSVAGRDEASNAAQPTARAQSSPAAPAKPRYDTNPARLRFEDSEVSFIKKLAFAIPTPRATKRLVNTYRLLKATVPEAELDRFLGKPSGPKPYELVLVLLAVTIGFGDRAFDLFRRLRADSVALLHEPNPDDGLDDLRTALAPALAEANLPVDPAAISRWIAVVSRYSFNVYSDLPDQSPRGQDAAGIA